MHSRDLKSVRRMRKNEILWLREETEVSICRMLKGVLVEI